MHRITITVNGQEHHCEVSPESLLVSLLREQLGLTGTHVGCDTSQCGCCTVLLDGVSVKACAVLAVQADGKVLIGGSFTTVGGMARNRVARLNAEVVKALQSPDVRSKIEEAGAEAVGDTPAAFGAYIRSELDRWGKLVRATGAKAD